MGKKTKEEFIAQENLIYNVWAEQCVKRSIDPENPSPEASNILFNAYVKAFEDSEVWGETWYSIVADMTPEERQDMANQNNQP